MKVGIKYSIVKKLYKLQLTLFIIEKAKEYSIAKNYNHI